MIIKMKITHVIRGDDHMINFFKQKTDLQPLWNLVFQTVHIPLIHSEQGKNYLREIMPPLLKITLK